MTNFIATRPDFLRWIGGSVIEMAPDPVELASELAGTAALRSLTEARLAPVLLDQVNRGLLLLPADAVAELRAAALQDLARSVALEGYACAVAEVFETVGCEVRVIKGLATGHLDYPNPALRAFGDVDLLVPADEVQRAMEALWAADLAGDFLPIRGGRWQVQHAVTFVSEKLEADVHHRPLPQAAGLRAARLDWFAAPDSFLAGGHRLLAPPAPKRLLIAAASIGLGEDKPAACLDVLRIQHEHAGALEGARDMAGEVGLAWVLERGLQRVWAQYHPFGRAGLPSPRTASSFLDGAFRYVYASKRAGSERRSLLELAVAPWRTKSLIVRSVLAPGESYLQQRGRTRGDHILRQIRRLKR